MRDVLIIGGGIAGLSAAYYLRKQAETSGRSLRLGVIESATHFGGKIVTERVDGFILEGGPDAFGSHKPWVLNLVQELGLEDRLLPSHDKPGSTLVYSDRRLIELPSGLEDLIPDRIMPFLSSPLLPWSAKVRMLWERFIPRRREQEDESVADFVGRRLGTAALERLAEPLLASGQAGEIERMSLRASFPQLSDFEKRHGSLWQGLGAKRKARSQTRAAPLWTLREGMSELVDALAQELRPEERLLGRRVVRVERSGEAGSFRVCLRDGSSLASSALILATPSHVSASLVADIEPELSSCLASIRYASVATLSLAYLQEDLPKPLLGFKFLVPRQEQRYILACTWTSAQFDQRSAEDHALLRVWIGGSQQDALLEENDETLVRRVRRDLRRIMGLRATPVLGKLYRWPKGYPQYDVGHLETVRILKERLPAGLFLTGSAFDGVDLPDCIHSSRQIAQQVFEASAPDALA